jgi:hypothetical protein
VVGPNGPAGNAKVNLEVVDSDNLDWMTLRSHTNEEGQFSFGVPPGQYVLSVDPGAYAGRAWYGRNAAVCTSSLADTLKIKPSSGTTRADFTLGGLELNLELPSEIENRRVTCFLYPPSGGYHSAKTVEVSSESSVEYEFEFLPPAAYKVLVDIDWPWRYESSSLWLPSALEPTAADSVEIEAGEMASWEVIVPVPGYVRGVVQCDWVRLGIEPARVYANTAEYGMLADQRVDHLGAYNIPIFGAGSIRLRVYVRGASRWIGGDSFESADEFVIGSGVTVNVDPHIVGGIFCRLVGDEDWKPYSARVVVYETDLSEGHSSPVRDDGTIPYLNDPPGTYLLGVEPIESSPWRPQWYDRSNTVEGATPVVLTSQEELMEIDFILELGGKIRGRVLDIDGAPAPQVDLHVSVRNTPWYFWEITKTGWDGTFLIEGLPDGDIAIAAQNPGSSYSSQRTWYPGVRDSDSAQVITIEDASEVDGIEWQLVQ